MKDLPRNASWLMAKTLNPGGNGRERAVSVRDDEESGPGVGRSLAESVRNAGMALRDVLPATSDSVEVRLARARTATEQARVAEDQALASAQLAQEKVEAAKRIDLEERARLKEVRQEHAEEVQARVSEARRSAEEQIETLRMAAEREADEQSAQAAEAAAQRVADAQEEAERAKQQAERDLATATEQLAEARRLADEATAAAEAAAKDAHQEATRLSARTRSGAQDRDIVIAEAEKLQQANASATTSVVRKVTRARRPAGRSAPKRSTPSRPPRRGSGRNFGSMSRQELLELARARDITGRSAMSKAELVRALQASNRRRPR
jgi:hypothetical protein